MPSMLIGPRRESGAFYKKRPEVRRPRKGSSRGLTKTQTKAVNNLIVRSAETKYCVSTIAGDFIAELPKTFTTPTGWNYVMPEIAQGGVGAVNNNQRVGERISNVRGKTTMYFYLSNLALGLTQDVFVKIFYGQHRSVRDFNLFPSLQKNTLLEVGDQSTTDWNEDVLLTTPNQLATMPVSKTSWVLKTKVIRLTANGGAMNGGASPSSPHATQPSHFKFVWNWSHKGAVKYPSVSPNENIPTNFCPVFIAVPYFANEQVVEGVSPVVSMQWRNEVYFKDI